MRMMGWNALGFHDDWFTPAKALVFTHESLSFALRTCGLLSLY